MDPAINQGNKPTSAEFASSFAYSNTSLREDHVLCVDTKNFIIEFYP